MVDLPFGFDRPEDSPGFLLWQTTTIWQRLIKKALEKYDVSHAQFVIMTTLLWFEAHECDVTQVRIINLTKLDKMTVSKSLKKLVMSGLVDRSEHQADPRAKNVSLTSKGKTLVRKLVILVEGIDKIFFEKLRKKEQKTLIALFRKLAAS